jgi:hypothetical protein
LSLAKQSSGAEVTVSAVMTAPRYECVAARNAIEKAFRSLGIPLMISGGVYYHQCMQNMLADLLAESVDYVITVDFDSVFLPQHVQRLLNIIANDDRIDAIAPAQPKRSAGSLMATIDNKTSVTWDGTPLRVRTAHFGLTVIDLRKLKSVEKPWFLPVPNGDGEWSEGRCDADVFFWRQWEKAGNSLFLDPGTRLGHLEEMVTYFDEDMVKRHAYLSDWKQTAKVD